MTNHAHNRRASDRSPIDKISVLSPIWLVPLFAALVALGLAWQAWIEQGPKVEIVFTDASGISTGKTQVRYKNVNVGLVEEVHLDEDLSRVHVTAQLDPVMDEHISENSRFWVVTPRISASGVSGLDTLLSGVYIELDPGLKGTPKYDFEGLNSPPLVHSYDDGSTFKLLAESLGSLDIGSPVYHRDVKVGEVTNYALSTEEQLVEINLFINAPYDSLVNYGSHFWNVSGLGFDLDAAGISVNMQSISSVLSGGVAFDSPQFANQDDDSQAIGPNTIFHLFENRKAVTEGAFKKRFFYVLTFSESVRGLTVGAPVEFRGLKIGEVERIFLDANDEDNLDIFVVITLQPERLDDQRTHTLESVDERMKMLVDQGLRAHLRTASFITGALYVDFAFAEHIEGEFKSSWPYSHLPTAPSVARNLTQQFSSILEKIDRLPLNEASASALDSLDKLNRTISEIQNQYFGKQVSGILSRIDSVPIDEMSNTMVRSLESLDATVTELNRIVLSAELDGTLASFQSTAEKFDPALSSATAALDQMRSTLELLESNLTPESQFQYELLQTIENVGDAAQSVRTLTDELSRYPQSLLLGGGDRE
ncbi:MAG: MlaD family protein [Pseudomonadota bacterium]